MYGFRAQRRFTLSWLAVFCLAATSANAAPDEKDFRLDAGGLKNGGKDFRIKAFHVPRAGESEAHFSVRVSNLARIAEVGGNTISFDLSGFNEDGTKLSAEGVAAVSAYTGRVKTQWMGVLVRVLGDTQDAAFRKNAVRTAAAALKDFGGAAYWIDGPDAGALARAFKEIAPDLLLFAPEGGDVHSTDVLPGSAPEDNVLINGHLPPLEWEKAHFVAPLTPERLRALDIAMAHPVERMPWIPDNTVLSEAERKDGFLALFNGRNLDGWWVAGGNPDAFQVKDGVLEWVESGGRGLYTRDRYGDFILRLEWKIEKGGNNGIWLRAPRGGRASKIGIECQLRGDSEVEEPGKGNTCAVYDVLPPLKQAAKPEGEWNDLEIVFQGARYQCTLNGERVQNVDFNDHEELKYRLRKGFICITDHGDYAAYRNIRIKVL